MHERLIALQKEVKKHVDEIWIDEPKDVMFIRNGYIKSGAGIKNQYFTTLVMLSGEIRALGIHIFSDLLHYAKDGSFSLQQLIKMTKKSLQVDLGVVGYFGLESYGKLLRQYYDSLDLMETLDEYVLLTKDLFTLTNRYQLWLHQIFPWNLSVLFPKADIDDLRNFIKQI